MKNAEIYIKELIKITQRSMNRGEEPIACVIVERTTGEMIGKAHNMVHIRTDPTQHAVIVAIGDACHNLQTVDLSNCVLYASYKPCLMCLMAMRYANICKTYYGEK